MGVQLGELGGDLARLRVELGQALFGLIDDHGGRLVQISLVRRVELHDLFRSAQNLHKRLQSEVVARNNRYFLHRLTLLNISDDLVDQRGV